MLSALHMRSKWLWIFTSAEKSRRIARRNCIQCFQSSEPSSTARFMHSKKWNKRNFGPNSMSSEIQGDSVIVAQEYNICSMETPVAETIAIKMEGVQAKAGHSLY